MPWEVCLKHRKIRREIILRVRVHHRTGSGVCFLSKQDAAIVQEQDPWLPTRRCRCDSGWPHHFPMINTAGASSRSGVSKTPRAWGSTRTPCHFPKTRSSQVVRQRSHTPRTAGSNPASATPFTLPWPSRSGIRLRNGNTQVQLLPEAPLPRSCQRSMPVC